jgi:peptidoglycan-associated lipoprotein
LICGEPRIAMRTSSAVVCALLVASSFVCTACGKESKPAQSAHDTPGIVSTTSAAPRTAPQALSMSDGLRNVCGIEDTGAAPKFDFDSALLPPSDRSELDQLAACMTTGKLAGKNVVLVGRADPRGEVEYNMNLGASRASAVKDYLGRLGVPPTRFETTSRGALDATGTDEATWATDRRVDLRLAGRAQ